MEVKRIKISEFINSMEGEELDAATCLMGGASEEKEKRNGSRNGGACTNSTMDSCNYSINDGPCKNVTSYCDHSMNGADCNNSYEMPSK